MKKSLIILPLIFLISLVVAYANIDCNLTIPTNNGANWITGNSVLNVTYNVSSDASTGNVSVFFEGLCASTRNSTFSFIANLTNSSNLRHVNFSFTTDTSALVFEDSNDCQFRATCYLNGSGALGSATSGYVATSATTTSVTVDRTVPTAPSAITFSNPLKSGDTITATINRADANRCFVRFGGVNVPRSAMTLSGSTCTFTVASQSPPNSDYIAFIEADDRANSTLSTQQNIIIRGTALGGGGLAGATISLPSSSGGGGGGNVNPFAPNNSSNTTTTIVVILLLLLLAKLWKN